MSEFDNEYEVNPDGPPELVVFALGFTFVCGVTALLLIAGGADWLIKHMGRKGGKAW